MCPDKSVISAYMDGEIDSQWSPIIKKHILECEECSSFLRNLEKQKEMLHSAPVPCFNDSLTSVKNRIRERQTISSSQRFWEKRISLPLATAAAVVIASTAIGVNMLSINRTNNPYMVSQDKNNSSSYTIDFPGEELDEIFSRIETSNSERFSSDAVVTLPPDIDLVFHGDSQLVRTAGFNGEDSH